MRLMTRPLAVALTLALLIGGCASPELADHADATVALIDLERDYTRARAALEAELDRLPTEAGLELIELETAADAYVAKLRAAWSAGAGNQALDRLYHEGRALYLRAKRLLSPLVDSLTPTTWALLGRLDHQAQVVDSLYHRIRQGDPRTRDLIRAGLALATLALRIGLEAL